LANHPVQVINVVLLMLFGLATLKGFGHIL
jgi:hypothetical protein